MMTRSSLSSPMARSWTPVHSGADWWEDGFEDDMNLVRRRRKAAFAEDRGGSPARLPQKQKQRTSPRSPRPAR